MVVSRASGADGAVRANAASCTTIPIRPRPGPTVAACGPRDAASHGGESRGSSPGPVTHQQNPSSHPATRPDVTTPCPPFSSTLPSLQPYPRPFAPVLSSRRPSGVLAPSPSPRPPRMGQNAPPRPTPRPTSSLRSSGVHPVARPRFVQVPAPPPCPRRGSANGLTPNRTPPTPRTGTRGVGSAASPPSAPASWSVSRETLSACVPTPARPQAPGTLLRVRSCPGARDLPADDEGFRTGPGRLVAQGSVAEASAPGTCPHGNHVPNWRALSAPARRGPTTTPCLLSGNHHQVQVHHQLQG